MLMGEPNDAEESNAERSWNIPPAGERQRSSTGPVAGHRPAESPCERDRSVDDGSLFSVFEGEPAPIFVMEEIDGPESSDSVEGPASSVAVCTDGLPLGAQSHGVDAADGDAADGDAADGDAADGDAADGDDADGDDVFFFSPNDTADDEQDRKPGNPVTPPLFVSVVSTPMSGAAYGCRPAATAWLSSSAPLSHRFYLGPQQNATAGFRRDSYDLRVKSTYTTCQSLSQGSSHFAAAAVPQPLPDLVQNSPDVFRRRTYSESSVSVLAVRRFGSELRRISDVFEEEILEQRASLRAAATPTRRHVTDPALPTCGRSPEGSPGEVGGGRLKRRSSSILQDLKDFIRKSNSPSSL